MREKALATQLWALNYIRPILGTCLTQNTKKMISHQEMLDIVCTEAIEHGGLQEVPGQKHGAKQSFHSAKRWTRGPNVFNGDRADTTAQTVEYNLRLVVEEDGTLEWKD